MPVHRSIHALDESLSRLCNLSHVQRSKNSLLSTDEQVSSTYISSTGSSTFESLPVELQIEIFDHCSPVYPKLSKQAFPLPLLEVCKGWRALITSTPRLWSSFEIEIKGPPVNTFEYDMNILAALEMWLKRSRSYPLSFKIVHQPYTSGPLPDMRSARILEMLVSHSDRWKHAHIIVPNICLAVAQSLVPHRFPSLLSLTLQTNGPWEPEVPFDIHSLGAPWSQLTSLDLQPDYNHLLTLDDLLWILSEAVNLKSCTLGADCILSADARKIDCIHRPALEDLKIVFQGGLNSGNGERPEQHMVDFLTLLMLPSIRSFQIEWLVQWNGIGGLDSWSPIHQSQFASFLRHIGNTVETLGLIYLPLGKDDVLQCIKHVPNVKLLDIRSSFAEERNDPVTDDFFRALTVNSSALNSRSSTASLPALQEISLMCNGGSYHPATLLTMIQSRRESGKQLKKVHLITMTSVPDVVYESLNLFKIDGLDVTIDTINIR